MPLPFSTLENPFAPEKHRSADDPALVGKILGAEAEKVMRKVVGKTGEKKFDTKADIDLTDTEREHITEEQKRREVFECARKDLLTWAQAIGKDEEWVRKTFTIHPDGTLTVEGNLDLQNLPVTYLPKGLVKVGGDFFLQHTSITSCEGFPRIVGGIIDVANTKIDSLEGFPEEVGGDIDLTSIPIRSLRGLPKIIPYDLYIEATHITSLDGLPPVENVGGIIHFSKNTEEALKLQSEAERLGYNHTDD